MATKNELQKLAASMGFRLVSRPCFDGQCWNVVSRGGVYPFGRGANLEGPFLLRWLKQYGQPGQDWRTYRYYLKDFNDRLGEKPAPLGRW